MTWIDNSLRRILTCFCTSKNIFEISLQVCEKLDYSKPQLLLCVSTCRLLYHVIWQLSIRACAYSTSGAPGFPRIFAQTTRRLTTTRSRRKKQNSFKREEAFRNEILLVGDLYDIIYREQKLNDNNFAINNRC